VQLAHSVVGGSFCELLVMVGSIQDTYGYLPEVSGQGPDLRGLSNLANTTPSHYAVVT
jgi:hypothetical protein